MTAPTLTRKEGLRRLLTLGAMLAAACSSTTEPTPPSQPSPAGPVATTSLDRSDLVASGTVVPTADGYTVDGTLTVRMSDSTNTRFEDADLRVRFDSSNRVTSISGTARVPSPSERIEFANPVHAEVGVFSGAFLNANRDLGILLNDETDYFVFDLSASFQMRIATGETGADATKPLTVGLPIGGRLLMVVDYRDPMYYVFGAQDLIGEAGIGWSRNSRIPFVPRHPVAGLGTFEGQTTRVGSFPVFRVFKVSGQLVDNEYTEVHLSAEDPFASDVRRGYQAGFNGALDFSLDLKGIVGIDIPIADGSGGVWAEAGIQGGFGAHAYAKGMTSRDSSWWPALIPARPVTQLDVEAYVTQVGEFNVDLAGEFGWDLPAGRQSMAGSFTLTNDAMTLAGAIRDGNVLLNATGVVTKAATTLYVEPPQALLDRIGGSVNDSLLPRISEAQAKWDDLKRATADYELELSLRGLRSSIPEIVDVARMALADGISAELANHQGTVYYSDLKAHLDAADDPYYAALARLRAAALEVQDNATTRATIEAALRDVAARKIFTTTYVYRAPIIGTVLKTVTVNKRIMSDANAAALLNAADHVKYIKETSDRRITAQQVYDQVDDRALFEQVRDDIQDGLVVIRKISELGVVHPSGTAQPEYDLYAVIDGKRYEAGAVSALTVDALARSLLGRMIDALKAD